MEKLLAQSLDGVRAAKDDARSVLGIYYNGYLYNGNGYGRSANGDEISLKRIRREAIVKFYETILRAGEYDSGGGGRFSDRGNEEETGR